MLAIGSPAPDFSTRDSAGNPVSLASLRGRFAALCFYPKDFTPACTAQACSLRDAYSELASLGIAVIGISADSPEQHQKFAAAHHLPYSLISDDGSLAKLYQVPRSVFGLFPGRVTYLIDPSGKVQAAFRSQLDIKGHLSTIRAATQPKP